MPPRSRTKPGSAARRPKVAGLRQHAHAGAASPDLTEQDFDDRPLDASPVADRDTAPAASTTAPAPLATPATVPADPPEDTPSESSEPTGADGTATATPVTYGDVAPSEPTRAAAATDTTTVGTAPAEAPADDTAAEETTAHPAADASTSTVPSTETSPEESSEDATVDAAEGEPTTDGAATTVTTPRPKGRRTTRMTPRADAPTTVRPGRDEDPAASPTRTARPTRVRGRTPESDGAPRRFERQRAALTRFGGSKALPAPLVAVIVVCLVLAGLAFWQGRQAWTSGPVSNQAVVDVGGTAELVGQSRESIEKIFSYDFTRLDDSVEAARTMSTGQFTDRYLSVFDQTIRTPAQQQQLRQTATVQNIGVVSMRDDRATVMALTQFSAQRTTTGQSTNAPGLLRLEMERVDGRWKLAELTPLTANR
ncbi:hypothetical protein [Actinomycetospora chibensis]|uniref:Mce-associated membrane protein n=1 Tax=Actinomycetospora chibensis TaxID=663606 RepID=A0ABV9RLH9_9PSEU|nr:hypothetical protein [Actinomycetospora chibensis]MDD7926061.1 hypothetical protein [Actinomycetospora chibensis]